MRSTSSSSSSSSSRAGSSYAGSFPAILFLVIHCLLIALILLMVLVVVILTVQARSVITDLYRGTDASFNYIMKRIHTQYTLFGESLRDEYRCLVDLWMANARSVRIAPPGRGRLPDCDPGYINLGLICYKPPDWTHWFGQFTDRFSRSCGGDCEVKGWLGLCYPGCSRPDDECFLNWRRVQINLPSWSKYVIGLVPSFLLDNLSVPVCFAYNGCPDSSGNQNPTSAGEPVSAPTCYLDSIKNGVVVTYPPS